MFSLKAKGKGGGVLNGSKKSFLNIGFQWYVTQNSVTRKSNSKVQLINSAQTILLWHQNWYHVKLNLKKIKHICNLFDGSFGVPMNKTRKQIVDVMYKKCKLKSVRIFFVLNFILSKFIGHKWNRKKKIISSSFAGVGITVSPLPFPHPPLTKNSNKGHLTFLSLSLFSLWLITKEGW